MPEETHPLPPAAPSSDPIPEPAEATPEPPLDPRLDLGPGPGINIGEEFGTAKRNLPPAKIVGIVLAGRVLPAGFFPFLAGRLYSSAFSPFSTGRSLRVEGRWTTLQSRKFPTRTRCSWQSTSR